MVLNCGSIIDQRVLELLIHVLCFFFIFFLSSPRSAVVRDYAPEAKEIAGQKHYDCTRFKSKVT